MPTEYTQMYNKLVSDGLKIYGLKDGLCVTMTSLKILHKDVELNEI